MILPIKRQHIKAEEGYESEHEYSEEGYYDEEDYYDEDDSFIEYDDNEEQTKKLVRNITGFDPNKFKDIDRLPTSGMESSASRVLNEERYTARIGRIEDQRELERELEREMKKKRLR